MEQRSTLENDPRTAPGEGGRASGRHDLVSEQTVEIGIRLQDVLGTSDAALFLRNNVIAIEVALRVLLEPKQRRKIEPEAAVSAMPLPLPTGTGLSVVRNPDDLDFSGAKYVD